MNLLQALALIKEPNRTTPEQSKQLLDFGLPAASADCLLRRGKKSSVWYTECVDNFNVSTFDEAKQLLLTSFENKIEVLPCWSVGQLIKIYLICNPYESDEDLMFMLTSGIEVPDLCHYIITWLEYIKPNFDKVNEIVG